MQDKKISTVIIEDSEVDMWLINFMLKKITEIDIQGTAQNGDKGMTLIEDILPKIVFLDLDLPGKSGLELAKIVQHRKMNTSIVFITAFEQYSAEMTEYEPFDYLVKPITFDTLKDVVNRFISTNMDSVN